MKTVGLFGICLSLLVAAPARAVCSAANTYNFNFSSQTAASLNYANSYTYAATSAALGTQNFTVSFASPTGYNATTGIGTLPEISTDVNGGAGNALVMGGIHAGRTADMTTSTNVLVTTLTFPTAVRDATFTIHDIDYLLNQFRDWIHIVGISAAGNQVPAITTPFSMANVSGPFTNASSSVKLGPQATPLAVAVQQGVGVGASNNNSTTGNISVAFAQPVTSIQLRYGNYPLQTGETVTGQQFYALSAVSWCPMPSLTILKSSTAYSTVATDINRFNIPGADVIYTLTVANTNSSPVDAGSLIVSDPLPAAMTFYNGDVDDAGPLTTNYEFLPGSSGLTFAPANLSYSNNGGGSFGYPPAAGYDAMINAIRFAPVGSMAANSSFSLRFRTRIK
jgi:uncharacterized repeat protein (TIGR01451 family)